LPRNRGSRAANPVVYRGPGFKVEAIRRSFDRFGGGRYRRILVPVISEERLFVRNIYEGVAE
jgi:hypothetical protein